MARSRCMYGMARLQVAIHRCWIGISASLSRRRIGIAALYCFMLLLVFHSVVASSRMWKQDSSISCIRGFREAGYSSFGGCWSFTGSMHEAHDACAFENVGLDAASNPEAIRFFGNMSDTVKMLQLPAPFILGSAHSSTATRRLIPGTTILVVNYQQHIPHFLEGLSSIVSGLHRSCQMCPSGKPCQMLFHQRVAWVEREWAPGTTLWQEAAMKVAMRSECGPVGALNPDLYNWIGLDGLLAVVPHNERPFIHFERLLIVNPGYQRRWFVANGACDWFRNTTWEAHGVTDGRRGRHVPKGDIALLLRRSSRSIVNVDDVADLMQKRFQRNVTFLSFEGQSFTQQAQAMGKLALLVAPHGAALSNIPFMPEGAAVVEIFPLHWHPQQYFDVLASSCGVQHWSYDNENRFLAVVPNGSECLSKYPTFPEYSVCANDESCMQCGKQSSTVVELDKLDAILHEVQQYMQRVETN